MTLTWEQAQEAFPAQLARAIAERTCFCVCGCRATDTPNGSIFGKTVPGLCGKCHGKGHERVAVAAMLVRDDAMTDEREVAVNYLREAGHDVSQTVASLAEKVEAGQPLTDVQVEKALRAKAADERAAEAAFRRLSAEHVRIGKQVDLTRIYIPTSIVGMYAVTGQKGDTVAVEVSRPTTGELAGYVVVRNVIGGSLVRYGVQDPQPAFVAWVESNHPAWLPLVSVFVRTYRGFLPQLIAEVVRDPQGARGLYNRVTGEGDGRGAERAGNAA